MLSPSESSVLSSQNSTNVTLHHQFVPVVLPPTLSFLPYHPLITMQKYTKKRNYNNNGFKICIYASFFLLLHSPVRLKLLYHPIIDRTFTYKIDDEKM